MFQDTLILRRPIVAIFSDTIKIATLQPYLLKKTLKAQKKLKELQTIYQYAIYICICWYSRFADFLWKMLILAELKGCVTWFMQFLDLLYVRYNCIKLHYWTIYLTDFREEGLFVHPHPGSAPKRPILNRVKFKL